MCYCVHLLHSYQEVSLKLDARGAIVDLLDNHYELLELSRSQLAAHAGVNVGQLSNWLRNGGPLSSQKEAQVAQVMLDRIEASLRQSPLPPSSPTLAARAEVLRSFGPRQRLLAAHPDAGLQGRPISPENPFYIKRATDDELKIRLDSKMIQLSVIGGPKTGRSSLLLAAQGMLEATWTVLYVDLAEYAETSTEVGGDEQQAQARFCTWLADRCEAQLAGSFRGTLTCRDDAVPWALHNVLANSQGGKCVLLLDHLERLPLRHTKSPSETKSWEFEILDMVLYDWLVKRVDQPALYSLGVVAAFDLEWSGLPRNRSGDRYSHSIAGSRYDRLYVQNMSEHEVGRLLQAREADAADIVALRERAWLECGGQAYLTQSFANALTNSDLQANCVEESVRIIAEAVCQSWSAPFRQMVAAEIKRILDPTLKDDDFIGEAARKALLSTGLCVPSSSEKQRSKERLPVKAVNPVHLRIFGEVIVRKATRGF